MTLTTSTPGTRYTHHQPLSYIIIVQVVLPVSCEFNPQLVLISAGYDPAFGCPEGEQSVSPACFSHLTHSLMSLAGGKVCAVLEGGYFPPSLAEGAALTLRSLLGDPCPSLPQPLSPAGANDHMRLVPNTNIPPL